MAAHYVLFHYYYSLYHSLITDTASFINLQFILILKLTFLIIYNHNLLNPYYYSINTTQQIFYKHSINIINIVVPNLVHHRNILICLPCLRLAYANRKVLNLII